jgi:hypothetical protein
MAARNSRVTTQIDISEVPQDKRNDPRFIQRYATLQNLMSNLGWVKAFCIHEAAHAFYHLRAGALKVIFIGPRLSYDSQKDDFTIYPASVKREGGLDQQYLARVTIGEWRNAFARACAAGGVAARKLTGISGDVGDEEDYQRLCEFCDAIEVKDPTTAVDHQALWRQAQNDVEKDLQTPSFRSELWKQAKEFERQLRRA